jgi:hypothetical protein
MTMTLLITDDHAGIRAAKAGLTDRLQEWARSSRLDSELARGVPPESTLALALHAERLTRPATCRQLARTLRRIVAGIGRPRSASTPTMPLSGEEIHAARHQLEALADRLVAPGPVSARGVAQVRLLITDGGGPLYRTLPGAPLKSRVAQAREALSPA